MRIPFQHLAWVCFAVGSLCFLSPLSSQEPIDSQPAEVDPPADAGLEQLAWLVGDWGEAGDTSSISTSCRWTKNRSFLNRSFSVSDNGEVVIEGTQIIGWNANQQRIESWAFDSEGGFGRGIWSQDGNRWTIKTHFVLATGERASSLNVFKMVDENTIRWQSVNRERDGEILPNVEEITVVRLAAVEPEETDQEK